MTSSLRKIRKIRFNLTFLARWETFLYTLLWSMEYGGLTIKKGYHAVVSPTFPLENLRLSSYPAADIVPAVRNNPEQPVQQTTKLQPLREN